MKPSAWSLKFLLLLLLPCRQLAAEIPQPPFVEIIQVTQTNRSHAWINANQTNLPAFRDLEQRTRWLAVDPSHWRPGLVPIFAVERHGITELRRRPPRGQENFSDPLFLALPAVTETESAALAGRWHVRAEGADSQRHQLTWELTSEDGQVAGRFDPNSEYRFAFVTSGTWRSNRLELLVDYVNEHFTLVGALAGGKLGGSWTKSDDSQSGTWTADRLGDPLTKTSETFQLIELFVWTTEGEPSPHYGDRPPDAHRPWKKSARPLCRVWLRPPVTRPAPGSPSF